MSSNGEGKWVGALGPLRYLTTGGGGSFSGVSLSFFFFFSFFFFPFRFADWQEKRQ